MMELLTAAAFILLGILFWSVIGGAVILWLDRKYYGDTDGRPGRLVEWVNQAPDHMEIVALWAWPVLLVVVMRGNRE